MLTTSNVLLELPKRAATLVEPPRVRARGLFWLTLATVVLAFVVVVASLWKTFTTQSLHSTPPAIVTTVAAPPPVPRAEPPEPPVVTEPIELPAEPAPDPAEPAPPGFPSLNQFP